MRFTKQQRNLDGRKVGEVGMDQGYLAMIMIFARGMIIGFTIGLYVGFGSRK